MNGEHDKRVDSLLEDCATVYGAPKAHPSEEHVATGCEWNQDVDGNWETGCGQMFVLNDGTPIENEMKFCCYCGLTLDELPYEDPADEEANQMGLDALKEEDETWLAEHPEVKS